MQFQSGLQQDISNSLILNFGSCQVTPVDVILPCAYTQQYYIQVTTYGWEYGCVEMNYTLTSFRPYNVYGKVSNGFCMWQTIGYQ